MFWQRVALPAARRQWRLTVCGEPPSLVWWVCRCQHSLVAGWLGGRGAVGGRDGVCVCACAGPGILSVTTVMTQTVQVRRGCRARGGRWWYYYSRAHPHQSSGLHLSAWGSPRNTSATTQLKPGSHLVTKLDAVSGELVECSVLAPSARGLKRGPWHLVSRPRVKQRRRRSWP